MQEFNLALRVHYAVANLGSFSTKPACRQSSPRFQRRDHSLTAPQQRINLRISKTALTLTSIIKSPRGRFAMSAIVAWVMVIGGLVWFISCLWLMPKEKNQDEFSTHLRR